MEDIESELVEIRTKCEKHIAHSRLISCSSTLVRVDLLSDRPNRTLTVCLRFPTDYPRCSILVELKSRGYSDKLHAELTRLMDNYARDQLGEPQALPVLRFAQQYLLDNPLCVCLDEIKQLRQDMKKPDLSTDDVVSQLKLRQRTSCVELIARGGRYVYRVTAAVPDDYPSRSVELRGVESDLPTVLVRYLVGQSREIARQCVEPPLRLNKDELAHFRPVRSLYRTLKFCLEATRDFHRELCPICDKPVLQAEPEAVVLDENADAFVERVYCGHLFHQGCLKHYLAEPPFPKGGKLCPAKRRHPRSDAQTYMDKQRSTVTGVTAAGSLKRSDDGTCGIRLAHDRWVVNVKTAEARWAQKQARQRELEEVVDFLQ
ncbi:GH11399 [Drosophila grimshawi]|uniref:GH11399 n=2 Tax=Drosophila grimshawi TaxID=7222 RepID=B4JA66_DROGR|nr:GH11399 [Drosophila grimshawi]